jgi:conjugal transfer ATP-binding protein TraC
VASIFRKPGLAEEIADIRDDLLVLRSGSPRAVVATSSLNFDELAPEQQARAAKAFCDLLHAQNGPLQLYLRVRRVRAGDEREPDAGESSYRPEYLHALTRSFVNTHFAETPVYQRQSFIVLASLSGRSLLRSWRFRFRRSEDEPLSVASDPGISLSSRVTALLEQLRLVGVTGTRLDNKALTALTSELSAADPATHRDAAHFIHRSDGVELAGRQYQSFVVNRYPGEEIEPGWLLPLLSFKGELHIGIHITPLDTDRMLTLLQRRIRDMRADELANQEQGALGRTEFGPLPDAMTVHQALARNEERVFAVSFYITVAADDAAQLRTQTEALRSACRRMMLRTVHPYFEMREALLSCWPLGTDLLGREQIMHSGALTTFFPWLQEDLADPEGHYWGYNKGTGGLCVFDPFDESRFPNANIAVVAHSGAGKSYAAASIVLSGYSRGIGAIVMDPEAEYGGMIRQLGGTYVHLAAGSGHAINALDPLLLGNGGEETTDQLSDVIDVIALMCGRLDEMERAQMEAALREVVDGNHQTAVLRDVWQRLEGNQPGSRVSTIMYRWVSGELGRLFSAPTNLDLNSSVVGFNLRDLSEELIPPAYLILANWLWTALRRDRRPRHLLIDEVGLLLEHEPIRRFLIRLARRIRKYGGSLILVSQNPGDFLDTKDGAVLATNPSILLLGSQKHSEALKLQKVFNLTDPQVGYLETAQRGDFLLVAGLNRLRLHVMSPPWMDELIVASRRH